MKFSSMASALNVRAEPGGAIIAELLLGDLIDVVPKKSNSVWVYGKILSGENVGQEGYVRRKWLAQHFESAPQLGNADRKSAAEIISRRTSEFDAVHYKLGDKAKSWAALKSKGYIDCSGWIYLLAAEILAQYGMTTKPGVLNTYSDEQITNIGQATGCIVSGEWLDPDLFMAGCIVGADFAEYSWDRNRPLDIDHVVIVGEDTGGKFVSQSSKSGGGVNRVPLSKWLKSTDHLRLAGRMHLVDLLMMS